MTLELVYNRVVVHGFYNFIAVGWIASYPILINKKHFTAIFNNYFKLLSDTYLLYIFEHTMCFF